MRPKTLVLFKILLNRYQKGKGDSFLKKLPPEDINEIRNCAISSSDITPMLSWQKDLISYIHYSWLAPVVSELPPGLKIACISALPEESSKKLRQLLKLKSSLLQLSQPIKSFLVKQLFRYWNPKIAMPPIYLPETPLTPLLNFSKVELVELIELLGVQDLAEAMRQIVDKKQLKSIYHSLSPKKQEYLRLCLQRKEKITLPPFPLDKWREDPKQLDALLHQRGIFRLGKALCGQHPDFFWYIQHVLDTGRGASLAKFYQEKETPGMTPLLIQQILALINFLKGKV